MPPNQWEVPYFPPKRPDLKYMLKPFEKDRVDEFVPLGVKAFLEETVTNGLNLSEKELIPISISSAKKNIQENLGVICQNEKDKMVGFILMEDLLTTDSNPLIPAEIFEKHKNLSDLSIFFACMKAPIVEAQSPISATPLESLYVQMIGVDADYYGLGIGTRMVKFITKEHPNTKMAKKFILEATGDVSRNMCVKLGFASIRKVAYADMKRKDGSMLFPNLEEIRKSLGLPYYKDCTVQIYLKGAK